MSYSIRIKRTAEREVRRVPKSERLRIIHAVDGLRENPLRGDLLKGDLRGLRRLRVGQYRVVYEVQHTALIVLVVRVAHRRSAYVRR